MSGFKPETFLRTVHIFSLNDRNICRILVTISEVIPTLLDSLALGWGNRQPVDTASTPVTRERERERERERALVTGQKRLSSAKHTA